METLPKQPIVEQPEPAFAGIATLTSNEGGELAVQSLVFAEPTLPTVADTLSYTVMDDGDRIVNSSWRDRFYQSKVGRLATRALMVLGTFGGVAGVALMEATPAHASAVQHVKGTDNEGLWLHPDSATIHSTITDLMSEGQTFDVQCFTIGDSVNGDTAWLYGTNEATGHTGYAADYYEDTNDTQGDEAQQLPQQGIPECGTQQSSDVPTDPQPAATVPPFITLDRNEAAQWALDHATDRPPNDGSCTIFASRDLWAAGVPQTPQWNDGLNLIRYGWRNGSRDAWAAENYVEYLRTQPFVTIEPLGQMSSSNNNVPDARLGDEIGYDWDNDGSIDHIDVITGFSGQYPLVSGWSEDGANALTYKQRGWTYSELHHTWLQLERDDNGNYPNMNMAAYLFHFNSEGDLNISN